MVYRSVTPKRNVIPYEPNNIKPEDPNPYNNPFKKPIVQRQLADPFDYEIMTNPVYKPYREIFEATYLIEIKAYHTYTQWHIEVVGLPTVNDPEWDRIMANQYNTTLVTIAKMAEFCREQIPFYFINQSDVPYIYDQCKAYIQFMVEILNKEYITEELLKQSPAYQAVIEDLDDLAYLANYLAGAVSYIRGNENAQLKSWRDSLRVLGYANPTLRRHRSTTQETKRLTEEERRSQYVLPRIAITEHMNDRTLSATKLYRRKA